LSVSASIGVAIRGAHGESLDELLHAADRALYSAKDAGRNTVRIASTASAGVTTSDAA
jgi:diguanylate cyclase (GGDEF)-like protein